VIRENEAQVTSDPLPTVYGSESLLGRLFQNLLGNAIKFRREEPPQVHVSAEPSADAWHFSVEDNGIGMDPENYEKIFAPLIRLHAESIFPGTGIGLAACRSIVERHGGESGSSLRRDAEARSVSPSAGNSARRSDIGRQKRKRDRVASGGYPPEAPTDPNVRN